ncbi:MAG: hypothetical protein AB1768_05620 [Pseudomonadota bacterium]
MLEVREKVLRFVHEMKNEETQEVSAVTVLTGVHLDTVLRRSCPFPEEVVRQAREWITEYDLGS